MSRIRSAFLRRTTIVLTFPLLVIYILLAAMYLAVRGIFVAVGFIFEAIAGLVKYGYREWWMTERLKGLKGPVVQLKWSDETVWKTIGPAHLQFATAEEILTEHRKLWAHQKAHYNMAVDCEFRIHTLD